MARVIGCEGQVTLSVEAAEPSSISTEAFQIAPTQASCPFRLQAQVLIVLDQVLHREVRMGPSRLILPLDKADSTPIAIPLLVMIAAVGIALTTRNIATLCGGPGLPY